MHAMIPTASHVMVNKNGKRVTCKFSYRESQDSFLMLLENPFELENSIKQLRSELAKQKRTLQPFIIGLGTNLFEIKHFYTFCDGVLCKFESFLAAVDCCFKLYFTFNLEYPCKCSNFWIFLQQKVYKIVLKTDKVSPSVLQIMCDFEKLE